MIDFWCKPDDLTDSFVTQLGLQNLVRLSDLNLELIPADKKKYVHLISVIGSQNDFFCILDFVIKSKIQNLSVILTENTYNEINKNHSGVNVKYFIFSEPNSQFSLESSNNCYYFSNNEAFYSENLSIHYFWPDFSYSEVKFNLLKHQPSRKIETLPFSIFNPDSAQGVDFNPVAYQINVFGDVTTGFDLSIVIPHYDNIRNLKCVLNNLKREVDRASAQIEVIVVDDGSGLSLQIVEELKSIFNFTLIQLNRRQKRHMGDCAYRAGVARNVGALWASGKILVFQDCDILLGHHFLQSLIHLHSHYSLVMPQRIQLNHGVFPEYGGIKPGDISTQQNSYWAEFYDQKVNWSDVPACWKYVSSYCLSVDKQYFYELGGFSNSFVSYGCEDVDLGLRVYKDKKPFYLSGEKVFHLQPPELRSEFNFDSAMRQDLLKRAYYYLYKRSYSEEVFKELILGKQK